jgi:large subunit ribosomal protein L18
MKQQAINLRKRRVRSKTKGTTLKPRLSVNRSNRFIYAQIIDDTKAKTILGVSEKTLSVSKVNKTQRAKNLGLLIAKKATEKKVKEVVFDRGSYRYHGRVKALADGAREGGLKF